MASPPNNPFFQVGLDVHGRRCVVLGGEDEAADKSARLVAAGAKVTVICPVVDAAISQAAADGELLWEVREPDLEQDLEDTFLVMNTCHGNADLVERVRSACVRQRILLNTYDDPERSDFGMAALVNKGHLRISISTSNASPTLAGRLRHQLEELFDEEFVEFLDLLGTIRRTLRERISDGAERRRRLRSLVEGFQLRAEVDLPTEWRQQLTQELEAAK